MSAAPKTVCRDSKWDKKGDSEIVKNMEPLDSRRIIFVRHGESQWNEVFNKGFGPSFPVRLASAMGGMRLCPLSPEWAIWTVQPHIQPDAAARCIAPSPPLGPVDPPPPPHLNNTRVGGSGLHGCL